MLRLFLKFFPYLALIILSQFKFEAWSDPVNWSSLQRGVEYTDIEISGFLNEKLSIVRSDLSHYSVKILRAADYNQDRMDVRTFCLRSGADICINANFFDEDGKPLGLVVNNGTIYQRVHRSGDTLTGIFQVGKNGVGIIHRSEFDAENVREAVQSGPRLVSKHLPVEGISKNKARSSRAGVCIDSSGRLVLFCLSATFRGLSMEELSQILIEPGIGCVEALNMDGGGSAQLFIGEKVTGSREGVIDIPGSDRVPVAIALVYH